MTPKWTNQELDFIQKNHSINYKDISKCINRTATAIRHKLNSMGYHQRVYYTNNEIQFLKDSYKHMNHQGMANKLGRTQSSIKSKCLELCLTIKRPRQLNHIELTPSLAYIIGCLCGDASIMSNKIRLAVKDKDFADEFYMHCKIVLANSDIKTTRYSSNGFFYVQIGSLEFVDYLINNYEWFKTKTWNVPDNIFNSSDEEILTNFLRGLFDSEGSMGRWGISMCTISPNMNRITTMLYKLGIKNKLIVEKRRTYNSNKVFTIYITSAKYLDIFRLKIGFSIQRKQDRLINYITRVNAWHNSHNHPTEEVLDRLSQEGITIYRTDLEGTINLKTDGKSYEITTN